jgi:hypothetical protein
MFSLANRAIAGLDDVMAFIHACYHAALGNSPPRLAPVRDVAQMLEFGVDVEDAIEYLGTTGCDAVLQRAATLVEGELGVALPDDLVQWTRRHTPSRFDRAALRAYDGPDRSYAAQAATTFWAMPSLRERVAYASALALPSREYVRARGTRYGTRLRRSVRIVQLWRPR